MSASNNWFVHVQGETMGPLPKEAIVLMLRQNRLQFSEFIWKEGFDDWVRIFEVEDFNPSLPKHPKVPVPSSSGEAVPAAPFKAPEKLKSSLKRVDEDALENTNPRIHANPVPPEEAKPHKVQRFPKIRRFSRVPLDAMMLTSDHGTYKVINVSSGGLFLKSKEPLPIGTDLKFKLDAKSLGKTIEMTAVVIRHSVEDEEIGFAVEFTRVNPAYRRLIEDFVGNNTRPAAEHATKHNKKT